MVLQQIPFKKTSSDKIMIMIKVLRQKMIAQTILMIITMIIAHHRKKQLIEILEMVLYSKRTPHRGVTCLKRLGDIIEVSNRSKSCNLKMP